MSKRHEELTFDEAKQRITVWLKAISKLAEVVHTDYLKDELLQDAIRLNELQVMVERASTPCISDDQIQHVHTFAEHLIKLEPNLRPKLTQLWNLQKDILEKLRNDPEKEYSPMQFIDKMMPRIYRAHRFGYDVYNTIAQGIKTIHGVASLLLVLIVEVESIEKTIMDQLKDAVRTFKLGDKYDVYEMCSVDSKVKKVTKKGIEWRTDVRAIRDAIAHHQFEIKQEGSMWIINFDNTTGGYDFKKQFTHVEFVNFLRHHSMLYLLQINLIVIVLILNLLIVHFRKK